MDDSSIPAPIDEGQGTNKGDDLNCCGKMTSLRKAGLTGSCSLPEQLGMSPSSTTTLGQISAWRISHVNRPKDRESVTS